MENKIMDDVTKFFEEEYPRIWKIAYEAGKEARKNGLPRICNLTGSIHCHNGNVLKPYKSAWEQGWDLYKIPLIFKKIEDSLKELPLHPFSDREY